jgi:serine protease Do
MLTEKNKIRNDIHHKLKPFVCFFSFFLLTMVNSMVSDAQQKHIVVQGLLNKAIGKAYTASVRIWGFDTEKNERTTAQFSGVVVSEDGIILTAAHTISPGITYKVFFPDGRAVIAKALGRIDLEATQGIPDAGMMQILSKNKFPFAQMAFSGTLHQNQPKCTRYNFFIH